LVVGEDAKFLVEGAKKIRPGDWIRWFSKKEDLAKAYRGAAQAGDRILVKGSRKEGMEWVAAELRGGK
jgi:UDP-N-acetylmuramyl pentapeptide synthase